MPCKNRTRFYLQDEIIRSTNLIHSFNDYTSRLKTIANRQKILSLNASIEAARSGEAGVEFAFVAKSMQELSSLFDKNEEEFIL